MFAEFLIILGLVTVNGILSGAEIAVVSVRATRLQELIDVRRSAASAVQRLRGQPERFLATVQIGITVVGATASVFGGATFARHLQPLLEDLAWIGPHAEQVSLALVVVLVSYLSIVLGELVPKSLALRSSERYALVVGRPLVLLAAAARPLVWFLTASSNAVLRLFGDRTTFIESRISPDELQQLVGEASKKGGTLHPTAGRIATRALELEELTAVDVMVPRNRVVALPASARADEVRETLTEAMHTRLPVHDGTLDRVIGYVNVKDLLFLAWDQKLFIVRDLMRAAYFVPEAMKAVDLLEEMRRRKQAIAIVVEERGGMVGIVTIEDLIEELVGEIASEHDQVGPERPRFSPDGWATVDASLPVRDVNRELGLALPEGDWTTVAGLCISLQGRIPAVGETLVVPEGVTVEVLEATPGQVRTVRLTRR